MRNQKFAIVANEANRSLIEFLNNGHYPFSCDHWDDMYFTFTINRSGHIGNRKSIKSASLYNRNEYNEHVPFAVINA